MAGALFDQVYIVYLLETIFQRPSFIYGNLVQIKLLGLEV